MSNQETVTTFIDYYDTDGSEHEVELRTDCRSTRPRYLLPALPGITGRSDLMSVALGHDLVVDHVVGHLVETERARIEEQGGKRDGFKLGQEWLQREGVVLRARFTGELSTEQSRDEIAALTAKGIEPRSVAMALLQMMGAA